MNISHLKEYIVLARCLSFTTAAQRIGISQPALSKHLVSLEEDLGVTLLERDRRSIQLTPAGVFVLERATELTMEYESMKQQARLLEKRRPRRIVVETLDSYHMFREVLRIAESDLLHSNSPLSVVEKNFDLTSERLVLEHIADGTVDLAVFPEIFTHIDSRFEHIHLYREQLGALIPSDSPLAEKDRLYVHDLEGIPVWIPCAPDSTSFMLGIQNLFLEQNVTPVFRSKYEYDYTRADAFNFSGGVYVNCYELFMGNLPSLLRKDYKCLRFEDEGMSVWIDAVWKKGCSTDIIDSFLSAFRKRLSQLGNSISVSPLSS